LEKTAKTRSSNFNRLAAVSKYLDSKFGQLGREERSVGVSVGGAPHRETH